MTDVYKRQVPEGRCLQMTESLHSSLEHQPQLQEICLRQLMLFGMKTYGIEDGIEAARAAITVMLCKLEGQLILAHPEYEMGNRLMLDRLDELQEDVYKRQV